MENIVLVVDDMELNRELLEEMLKDEYVLLPVWMLNIKYKDKIYPFAMNGQTGKMIGDIPLDKKKAIIWGILILVGTFLVCTVVWLIGGIL